jgi:hypothetical protein
MERHAIVLAALLALSWPRDADSAQPPDIIHLNLAENPTGADIEMPIAAGTAFRVRVINHVPNLTYNFRARRESIPILPFSIPGAGTRAATDQCEGVIGALEQDLDGATTETQVSQFIQNARAQANVCSTEKRKELETIIETATTYSFRAVVLDLGEQLIVEVSRVEGTNTLTWKLTLTTGPRGAWLTSYGVGFLPDNDEEYFSQSIGNDQFQIAKKEPPNGLDYVPAFFFTWLPRKWENGDWSISPTGGLGFELSDPVVFVGGAVGFNQNLQFIVGGAFHRQSRLAGQFQEGQTINENLTSDQLAVKPYKFNFFFSLAFRFGENPFKSE